MLSLISNAVKHVRPQMASLALRRHVHLSAGVEQQEAAREPSDDMPIQMDNPFRKEKINCILCKMNIEPDYKNVRLLSQFVSPFTGLVYGRHITGLCKQKQERLVREITKSQNAGFMPYYNKEPVYLEDPKLFNPDRPIRSHDF